MALNPNMTTSAGLSPTMQTYYDKKLLRNMKPNLVHYQFGQKRPMPRRNGKMVQFRKYTPFAPVTTPLTEGVVPDGQNIHQTEIFAKVEQYGAYATITDMLDMTALDPVVNDAVGLHGDQGSLSLDHLTRAAMAAGTNVQYANGKTSRGALTADDKMTMDEVAKAVRTLKKAKAPMFSRGGRRHYMAIVGPDAAYSLQKDPLWVGVATYQEKEKIYSGEIGRMLGVVFTETTEALVYEGEGAGGIDVLGIFIFGAEAYGVIDIDGGANAKSIIKPRGSAGTADPLNQFSTVGWKIEAYVAKLLQPTWLVRVECGAQA